MENTAEVKDAVNSWVDQLNEEIAEIAQGLKSVFKCDIDPFVFIVDPEKQDYAVGFFKKPDAMTAMKLVRMMGENYETGLKMIAQAQLVRAEDLMNMGVEGTASDKRFMDANGNYELSDSALNASLLLRAGQLINFYSDQFKKK